MLMSIQTIILHNDKCQTIFNLISFIISQGRNNHKHNGKDREKYEIHVHDEKFSAFNFF